MFTGMAGDGSFPCLQAWQEAVLFNIYRHGRNKHGFPVSEMEPISCLQLFTSGAFPHAWPQMAGSCGSFISVRVRNRPRLPASVLHLRIPG